MAPMSRSSQRAEKPVTVAVAHAKGGVGKTTTTLILGKYLSREWRVELRDYDESQHLSFLIAEMAPDEHSLTRRLWLRNGVDRTSDITLIDSAPARGPETRRALIEADYVLIPAPPERMALHALQQMLDTVDAVRAARVEGNPFLTVIGVVPTMFDVRWPDHRAYLDQMREECAERSVAVFRPVPRRHSYLSLSTAGQDYLPVAHAVAGLVEQHALAAHA
jgi:cellulose biosynthesis protein BcsQ